LIWYAGNAKSTTIIERVTPLARGAHVTEPECGASAGQASPLRAGSRPALKQGITEW
jgi:hypothetical protein